MVDMQRSADTFARFLDSLSRHMDDRAVLGGDLAAELYVSRSLLDRLVSAVAGEPPGRLRRRLLLERAAFRLRTADVRILDAAVEAGYSSNEAFTRAFQRAYGVPPSRWRASGVSFYIASRSGVHFYPPGGLRLPARKGLTRMNFTGDLIDHHVSVVGTLLDRAAALTTDQLDAPIKLNVESIDDSPTVRSLLSRLVGQLDMWNAAMASKSYDFGVEQNESLCSMRDRLSRGGTAFADYVRQAAEQDRLDETFVDATGCVPYAFTAAAMIAHVLTYAAYRRTLVVGALASMGVANVEDDPLTFFRR